jgi:hypothetical protein
VPSATEVLRRRTGRMIETEQKCKPVFEFVFGPIFGPPFLFASFRPSAFSISAFQLFTPSSYFLPNVSATSANLRRNTSGRTTVACPAKPNSHLSASSRLSSRSRTRSMPPGISVNSWLECNLRPRTSADADCFESSVCLPSDIYSWSILPPPIQD